MITKQKYRTHNCGELTLKDINSEIILSGWIKKKRDFGNILFVDLRDRYGITQLVIDPKIIGQAEFDEVLSLNRESVIQVFGIVKERSNKNLKLNTGEIEIETNKFKILSRSKVVPFTIEEKTDGGDELRMKYRFLDLRRPQLQENLLFRHKVSKSIRDFLNSDGFLEIETPFLIKSTPEGARDFVVPSRMNPGEFYALPQSPQTFKQLLMVAGYDKYYQIVRCFRDEDLRSDRQPEFTQLDCELSFVTKDQVLEVFEKMCKAVYKDVINIELPDFIKMEYDDAIKYYGSDKPDLRFGMKFNYITDLVNNSNFKVFNEAETVVGINVENGSNLSRKEIDRLIDFVKTPQVDANGLVWLKINEDGSYKSSVDKFFTEEDFSKWKNKFNAKNGDLLLFIAGKDKKSQKQLSELRLKLARDRNLISPNDFKPLWVVNFPLFELNEETNTWTSSHHPFTAAAPGYDIFDQNYDIKNLKADAYDLVINGVELSSGSVRIHDSKEQNKIFDILGLSEEEKELKFGFLLRAFEYGPPPHAGMAIGFDRFCAVMLGYESIRDLIPFPKNNSGRDVMLDAPTVIDKIQLEELGLIIK